MDELEALRDFKRITHARLDEMGIDKCEGAPCRILARLDAIKRHLSVGPPAGKSVLQDWVMKLPLREQGVLLTGVRGCDLSPKHQQDEVNSVERQLAAYLRYCTLNAADIREIDVPGAWFQSKPPTNWKPSQLGHFPLHWFTHVMHAYQIVGVRSPDHQNSRNAHTIYKRMVHSLHLEEESATRMILRLGEDRIAQGNVVS